MTGSPHGRTAIRDDAHRHRLQIRLVAAVASAATAILYFGIGVGVLKVVDGVSAAAPDLFAFGAPAGAAFALGAILLLAFDRRLLWVLGAILQVGVIVMYFGVAPQRTPAFEVWGILIKVLQTGILAALVYLVIRVPGHPSRTPSIARTSGR